ncbi:MAG: hypothetical protein AB8B86_11060 [Pseudomonadales bacterium]
MRSKLPFLFSIALLLVPFQVGAVELKARTAQTGAPVFVKTGVPFAQGKLMRKQQLSLLNSSGRRVPAQFDVLSRWPDQSIKSMLVSTMVAPGSGSAKLNLNVQNLESSSPVLDGTTASKLTVVEDDKQIVVQNGLIKFNINKERFNVMQGVWRDLDGNGSFDSNERQLGIGDIYLIDAASNVQYTASADRTPEVTIEESGPVRVVINAKGGLFSQSSRELTKYVVRIFAYANSDQIDLEYTLIDPRDDQSARDVPKKLPLSVKELGIRFAHTLGNSQFHFGGDNNKVHVGQISGEHFLTQTGRMNFVDGELNADDPFSLKYTGAGRGDKASGWLAIGSQKSSIGAMVKDFWQEFPNEMSITPKALIFRLHPARSIIGEPDTHQLILSESNNRYDRPDTLYSPRVGMAKTSRLRLVFKNSPIPAKQLVANNKHFQKHAPLMSASSSYYTSTGVFGNISPSNRSTKRFDNYLMDSIYEVSFKEGKIPILYGWRDYGDRLYHGWIDTENGVRVPGFYNDTHVGSNTFFKQYLRTGDLRWWHTAEIATHHFMDIDISHSRRYGRHSFNGKKFWSPPGEPMLISHGNYDHTTRGVHLGHAHVSGMTDYYLLTGDKRTKDAIDLTADWWKFMASRFFPTPRPKDPDDRQWAEAERDFAWPLYVTNELVKVSGDLQYHKEVSGQIVQHLLEWWKTPSKHEIDGRRLGTTDARRGTGWWAMDEMDNGDGTGTNPWMAGALLSSLIQFYQQDLLTPSGIQHSELKDMMWQGLNYVVKYGWNEQEKFFAYSESVYDQDGGSEHILYSLAYLHQLLESDKSKGLVAHPEWYDTSSKWLSIAKSQSKRFRSGWVGGEQDYGFYGYEFVYPLDFFNVMDELDGRRSAVAQ